MRVSDTIPNFIQGVSQQPAAIRLPSQGELQINGHSSVVDGQFKRPCSRHFAKLSASVSSSAFIHLINRDAAERYVVVIADGDLKVYDMADGSEKPVSFPDGKDYLAGANFGAVTIADFTFIVNRDITVAMTADTAPKTQANPAALVWIRQGGYGQTYKVVINGVTHTVTTSTSDPTEATTDYIASQLNASIDPMGGIDSGVRGSIVAIYSTTSAEIDIRTEDSLGNAGMVVYNGKAQSFALLPPNAPDNFQLEVQGSNGAGRDNFWVQFDADRQVWREIPEPGRPNTLDAATMPHVLISNGDGTFTFRKETWDTAKCGKDEPGSSPVPSFVGHAINDVFFYRDRLGFLADENVVLSQAGDYFNFWRQTMTAVLDDDPIDVSANHQKVTILRHAIPVNETVVFWSDSTQFVPGAAEVLTPNTIALRPTTEFEASLKAKPVGVGQAIYFATKSGRYSGVREYLVDKDTKTNRAEDTTAQVPKYIEGEIVRIAASDTENMLAVLADADRSRLYIYRWYIAGEEKVQSAWYRWDFEASDEILDLGFIETDLWLVVNRADGLYLDVMHLDAGAFDAGLDYQILLDRRLDADALTLSYDAGANLTTITMPFADEADFEAVALPSHATLPAGAMIPLTRTSPSTFTARGDHSAGGFVLGRKYVHRYRMSPIFVRQQQEGGVTPRTDGRLQLTRFGLSYAGAGYFRVEVTPLNRETYTYVHSGKVLGSAYTNVGVLRLMDGVFRFPVQANNLNVTIDFVNDSPFPAKFLTGDWEGSYTTKSRRIQ